MTGEDYQRLWKAFAGATDKAQAIRSLAEILADKEGRAFISCLGSKDAARLCIETLGDVSCSLYLPHSPPQTIRQGIAAPDIQPAEKQAFFVTLRRLAERHGLLPNRMRIAEKIEVPDEMLAFGAFADLKSGTYGGRTVAVKTIRVTAQDDFEKIKKVSISFDHPGHGLSNTVPAVLQGSRPLEYTMPLEHPEARRGSGRRRKTATRSRIRVDVTWEHYGLH